jgi:hypothetical protein
MKNYIICLVIIGTIISIQTLIAQEQYTPKNSWGGDIMLSMNGVGLGTFFRHEYTEDLSGFASFSISGSGDDNEIEYVDYYTGQTYTPGKVNRFLILPLLVGVQQRLFRDDIMDNFRPFVSAAMGPTMIYVFPYNREYFTALKYGRARYTIGGYIGAGAYFGSQSSSLMGLNLRYYFIPYGGGIQSMTNTKKTQFGGFFLSLSFGSAW